MVVLKPPYLNIVYKWREEAEACIRNMGKGMSVEQVRKFVDVYMKTYEVYLFDFYKKSTSYPKLIVQLNMSRTPVSVVLEENGCVRELKL